MSQGEITVRGITEDEVDAFQGSIFLAFGEDPEPSWIALENGILEVDRAVVATDGTAILGTAGVETLQLTVPGGTVVQAAGVTAVSVSAFHRRRGILTRLMGHQLADIHGRGEVLAALWASEPVIYGRFGYGLASLRYRLEVPRSGTELVQGPTDAGTRVRAAAVDRDSDDTTPAVTGPDADVIAGLQARAARERPGMFVRSAQRWAATFTDLAADRKGATRRFWAIADGPEGPEGYASYRLKASSSNDGEVLLGDLVALTPRAHLVLWRHLLAQDLMGVVKTRAVPVDDPLLHRLADVRRSGAQLRDGLFVRLVDVPAALAARRYAVPFDVVIEVEDAFCPWNAGTYRLTGGPDGATCVASDQPAQLALSARELGAAYLGGTTLASLAGAGRVEEREPGALLPTSVAFTSPVAPFCWDVF